MADNKKTIIQFLNQSYPGMSHRWTVTLVISAFIALFLVVFQPFGLSTYKGSDALLLISGYGLVTFGVLFIDLFVLPFLFKQWFQTENWTILKQLIILFWILFTMGIANTYYTSYAFSYELSLNSLFTFQLFTFAVGFIPIVVITFWNQNKLLKKNLRTAEELTQQLKTGEENNESDRVVSINSSNENQKVETGLSTLLFLESVGNYVQVHYIKDGKVLKEMMRNTINNVEEQLKVHDSIFKCHRAFLVNLSAVEVVRGNAQGLRIKLRLCDQDIPVSRNYTKLFREKLAEISC